jgi:hypothetical protein
MLDTFRSAMSIQDFPQIIVADLDHDYISSLKNALGDFRGVKTMEIGPQQLERGGIVDAVFLTLPQAEKWNARPILHQAQVLPTNPNESDDANMTPYVIAGVATSETDPSDSPVFDLKLVVRCILLAARDHNRMCDSIDNEIRRVGVWPPMIGMERLPPNIAAEAIVSTYESVLNSVDSTE